MGRRSGCKIPALLEYFNEIRFKANNLCFLFPKALIGNGEAFSFAHGLDNLRQIFISRGNMLTENTTAQVLALQEHITNSKTIEQPLLYCRAVYFISRLNEIAFVLLVKLYINAKLHADLVSVFPPCLADNVFVIIEITVPPLLVEFFQRKSMPRLCESIDFPNISCYQICCHEKKYCSPCILSKFASISSRMAL